MSHYLQTQITNLQSQHAFERAVTGNTSAECVALRYRIVKEMIQKFDEPTIIETFRERTAAVPGESVHSRLSWFTIDLIQRNRTTHLRI